MIGIVIVTYNSSDVIIDCLESLVQVTDRPFRIVICDNNSNDNTLEVLRAWSSSHAQEAVPRSDVPTPEIESSPLTVSSEFLDGERSENIPFSELKEVSILSLDRNLGFAGGVNTGVNFMLPYREFSMFWILNPDTTIHPSTPAAYISAANKAGEFSLMGCRTRYIDWPEKIQTDAGGVVNRWTGICSNFNRGRSEQEAILPSRKDIDYISGMNLVASRTMVERVGLMREDYFLYYEEIDWAFRRGDLPLVIAEDGCVFHKSGSSIGSGNLNTTSNAFSNYFNFRNRIRFVFRFYPLRLPIAFTFNLLKVIHIAIFDDPGAALGGLLGMAQLPPTAKMRQRISKHDQKLAFGNFWGRE